MEQRARRGVSVTLAIVIDLAHTSEPPLRAAVELLDRQGLPIPTYEGTRVRASAHRRSLDILP
jgi:hypothetical protein